MWAGHNTVWESGDMRITKTGVGDDVSYCVYAGKLYLGSERALEAARDLALTRQRKEPTHDEQRSVAPLVGSGADIGDSKPPDHIGPSCYPVNGRVRGSLIDAFYPKKETT